MSSVPVYDRAVDAYYDTRCPVRHALPPVKRRDRERREDGISAFDLGRDIERQKLGLEPKYS